MHDEIGRHTNKHGLSRSIGGATSPDGVPDYVHCVLDEHRDHHPDDCKDKEHCERCRRTEARSYCGNAIDGFHFVDIDHAVSNARNNGRLLVCAHCAKAIALVLLAHTWPDLTGPLAIPKKPYEP